MSQLLVAAPLFVPLLAGATCLLVRHRTARHALGLAGTAGLLASGLLLLVETLRDGILVLELGSWAAPYGIVLVADTLSALMVVLTGVVALAGLAYHLAVEARDWGGEGGAIAPLHLLLLGVCGAFLTGDLFNLFVWFEVMLMASFVLLVAGGRRDQAEAAVKYVALNLLGSILFLSAVGLVYASTGTVNLAQLAVVVQDLGAQRRAEITVASGLLVVAFGLKAGLFPLFFWLPASYHTAPVAINAIFAGLLTKVGVYALIRVYTLVFPLGSSAIHPLLMWLGVATMIVGVLGALAQQELRRILSFHIVSQVGYMVLGLGMGGALAIAASVFYVAHNIVVKSNLLLVCGYVARIGGSEHLHRLRGVRATRPVLAALFLIPALSLAGVPPLSGFFAKLGVVVACLRHQEFAVAAAALAVGMLTLLSMLKIWNGAFAEAADRPEEPSPRQPATPLWSMAGLSALTVAIGLTAGPLFDLCLRAGDELTQRDGYIQAVLGGRR